MKREFEKRIKKYIVVSMLILIMLNSLSVVCLLKVIDSYIGKSGEYAAIELKDTYEKAYDLESYYHSNSLEYNRYFLGEWYSIVENLYDEIKDVPHLRQEFFEYLDEVQSSTNLNIAIYEASLVRAIYPNYDGRDTQKKQLPLIPEEVLEELQNGDNVLFESQEGDDLTTTKIMKMETGEHLMITFKGDCDFNEFYTDTALSHVKMAFDKNERYMAYYVTNNVNEIFFSSESSLKTKRLAIKNHDKTNLMDFSADNRWIVYRDTFYVNEKKYSKAAFYLMPLIDGNRLVVIVDESFDASINNRIIFIALLITFVGIIVLYFIGTVMIFLVDRYKLTAHRVTHSNQVNRMIIAIFAVLILLNGMSIVQINKVIFTQGYEDYALKALEDYAEIVLERENQFKHFINTTRKDDLVQSYFIYKGMKLVGGDFYIPQYSTKAVTAISEIKSVNQKVQQSIKEKGYFEYYQGLKLFRKNDFDNFYENYVLEGLPGEHLHTIYRRIIYPSLKGEGYLILTKDMGKQMSILNGLRQTFKDICKPYENELFVSNIVVYNDTGTAVISNGHNEKFASRKLKDELTGYPMWYWYQFKHNELFRTVVKSIDGTYKENYSLVYYQKDYEYYFVYSVARKVIFKEVEQLYNLYVSAMMFLLVSVFLTLGVKIRLSRKE